MFQRFCKQWELFTSCGKLSPITQEGALYRISSLMWCGRRLQTNCWRSSHQWRYSAPQHSAALSSTPSHAILLEQHAFEISAAAKLCSFEVTAEKWKICSETLLNVIYAHHLKAAYTTEKHINKESKKHVWVDFTLSAPSAFTYYTLFSHCSCEMLRGVQSIAS